MTYFSLNTIHPTWLPIVQEALLALPANYPATLQKTESWLPGPEKIFNAFSQPVSSIRYVLMGESPYPRAESANGFAFWDASVGTLWSSRGLSTPVNRATSLRNIIKMLLIARGNCEPHLTTQEAIAAIDKTPLVDSNRAFFQNFLDRGFLLLNASLVFRENTLPHDAKAWLPFMEVILSKVYDQNKKIELILFGNIAKKIDTLSQIKPLKRLVAEHPYNISFITNQEVINFFTPLSLLDKQ